MPESVPISHEYQKDSHLIIVTSKNFMKGIKIFTFVQPFVIITILLGI